MAVSFGGTARYEVVRQLGAGGNGVVYEVRDLEQGGRRVALKTLQRRDAEGLMRLKREFRALADVRHPNLVTLHELVAEGDESFFTLEHIDGVDLSSWLRPGAGRALSQEATADLGRTVRRVDQGLGAEALTRLRDAFRQLAEAVAFLHVHGLLHRDLKPANVMVTGEGRVVVLDFGLVSGADVSRSITEAEGRTIVGTAAYMAPEQVESSVVGPPADWYAVGVMLFEALTGRLPFEGSAVQVMVDKRTRPAPAPRDFWAGVPPDLDALCVSLLRATPEMRAGAREVSEIFGAVQAPPVQARETGFVGREAEVQALRSALGEVRQGGPRLVRVLGESGIGKSALTHRFLEEAAAGGAVVLAGRCYEREAVPFKALDSVVDALARYLAGLDEARIDAVQPRDAWALTRMFPVLGRVGPFARAPARATGGASELRRRAVRALRELVARMADRAPLVLAIDDAQWGDADSALVLDELLAPPDAPEVLVLMSARAEPPALKVQSLQPVDVRLAPLGPDDALRLARVAVGDEARAEAIARESGGNPFMLQQLAEVPAEQDAGLEGVMRARLEVLPADARRLLEVVAVAGAPVPEAVALEVAGLDAAAADVVQRLKADRLLRASGDGRLETWHDRLREPMLREVGPDAAQALHGRLARAWRAAAPGDLDAIAWHFTAADMTEEAMQATLEASRLATAQLAFERAAVLLRRALELLPADDLRRREVTVALGDALSDAGRGQDAADAYTEAIGQTTPGAALAENSLELRRRAAEQLLRSGRIDQGLALSREVLGQVGMRLAKTPRRALLMLAWRRLLVRLRGLEFAERPSETLDPAVLRRIDVCWSVSMGLAMVDTIRGASFQARQLLLALDAGEPHRVARALSAEAAFVATVGVAAEARARDLIERARRLSSRLGDARLRGLVDFCDGLTRFLAGRWREAAELTAQAERTFSDQGQAVTWEAANSRLFALWSLFYVGDISGLSKRIPALVAEAERRGDRYAVTSLRCGLANVSLLAAGAPQQAREAVRDAMSQWGSAQFHFQHYWALLSEAMVDLYLGRPADSLAWVESGWGQLRASMLLKIQNVRVEARYLRARLALATGDARGAARHAQALDDEHAPHARVLARAVHLGLAGARGAEGYPALLEQLVALDMHAFAAAARVRYGDAQGGELGNANRRAGLSWLTAQGVVEPEAFARMLLPAWAPR